MGRVKIFDYNLLRPVACGGRALLKSKPMTKYEQYTDQELKNIVYNARHSIRENSDKIDWAESYGKGWQNSCFIHDWWYSLSCAKRRLELAEAEIARRKARR